MTEDQEVTQENDETSQIINNQITLEREISVRDASIKGSNVGGHWIINTEITQEGKREEMFSG